MSRVNFPKIYNPANQTSQELIDNFVVRTDIFKEIFEEIKNSRMKYPEQHYIIQGIRGQGKTTLLLRIAYEIENDKKLRQRLVPIIFNEEQYNISRLYKLWETIAEYLEDLNEFRGLYEKMRELEDDEDYEQRCFQILENTLKKNHKKLILFIDNIDEMLTKFSRKEHHRLREVFVESAELRIIGASSVSMEFHYDYGKPFYQFFRMPQIKGLTTKETNTLLLKLGEHYKRERVRAIVENQPGRAESLRRITGGVIRTIIILFEIFVDDTSGNAFKDLEKILDSVTPLYKHKMEKLSAQQQEIIDYIALQWDAVSTRDIAQKTRLKSKAVSSQLKKLEKLYIIEKVKTDTKNYLYRISERFFNIWYLIRMGRKWDEKRVRFLVEFFQVWCDENELEKRVKNFYNSHTYAIILLWNNDIENAFKIFQDFLEEQESLNKFSENIILFFLLLMAKKQYVLTLKMFNESQFHLKDRFKPVYYALMFFLKEEYPNEYLKMGSELNQTVEEIIKKVHQLEHDY